MVLQEITEDMYNRMTEGGLAVLANVAFYSQNHQFQQRLNDVVEPCLSEFFSKKHCGCIQFLIHQITMGTTYEQMMQMEVLEEWMYGIEVARYSDDLECFAFRWPPPSTIVTSLFELLRVTRLSLKTDENYIMVVSHTLQENKRLLEGILTGKDGEDKNETQAILQKVCNHQCIHCSGPPAHELLELAQENDPSMFTYRVYCY